METRGDEGAAADFYDQALNQGDLLVAVEIEDTDLDPEQQRQQIKLADATLRKAGAVPIPLEKDV